MARYAKHVEISCGKQDNKDLLAAFAHLYEVGEQLSFYAYFAWPDDYKNFVIPALDLMDKSNNREASVIFCKESARNMQAAYSRVAETLARRTK
jgi:cobalamin biosynthesis Co2+ chelatase CbiK